MMSEYSEVNIQMSNLPSIVEALLATKHPCRNKNWQPNELEVHLEDTPRNRKLGKVLAKRHPELAVSFGGPVNLYGFQGDKRKQKAHIRINRKHVQSASNDIGVFLEKKGVQLHVSAYDKGNFGNTWQNQVVQNYGVAETKTKCRLEGWTFQETMLKNGSIKLEIQMPN